MKCKNCNHPISSHQENEFVGYCCSYCKDKYYKERNKHCFNCGLPLKDEDIYSKRFCSGGCAGEYDERFK